MYSDGRKVFRRFGRSSRRKKRSAQSQAKARKFSTIAHFHGVFQRFEAAHSLGAANSLPSELFRLLQSPPVRGAWEIQPVIKIEVIAEYLGIIVERAEVVD